jgi:2-iminobutanoate/2-iminopropanoate deaminase
MSTLVSVRDNVLADCDDLSKAERQELMALGLLSTAGSVRPFRGVPHEPGYSSVERQAVCAPSVLNEACEYGSAFSRGLRLDLGSYSLIFISGTASVDEVGNTVHKGDLRAQCWRTYRNITELLNAQGATWQDVVKCTCYLRDIERDYEEFNRVRTAFFDYLQLNPLPASVGIQARLCREDLLVEIEAIAILKKEK